MRRCSEFEYLGCGGNKNRYDTHDKCLSDCRPEEWHKASQMAKALAASSRPRNETVSQQQQSSMYDPNSPNAGLLNQISSIWGPKQDCKLSEWGPWGPCMMRSSSSRAESGKQLRYRYINRPSRYGGKACESLFDQRPCYGRPHYWR